MNSAAWSDRAIAFQLTARFEEDLSSPAAKAIYPQILRTMRKLKETPDLPGLRVGRLHVGLWYCRVNDDWRILFDWGQDNEPLFHRVLSHAAFDHLQASSFGDQQVTTWIHGTEVISEGPNPNSADDVPWARRPPVDANPLRNFSEVQLRVLGVPKDLVHNLRRADRIDTALEIDGLPQHAKDWLMQLATDPAEPLSQPFTVFKQATLEQLEGFCEGKIQDLLLRLAPEQEAFVRNDYAGPVLLRGCAGSGKSTVGVHRAIRCVLEGRRVLYVTFSPILQQVTRGLFERLLGGIPPEIRVVHTREWATTLLESTGVDVTPISDKEELALILSALEEVRKASTSAVLERDPAFFQNEFRRVIKGFGLSDFSAYRQIPRYGRKEALSPLGRHVMWRVFEAYQRTLTATGSRDWGDYLLQVNHLLEQRHGEPKVDDVIVDEAQDLSPVELRALRSLLGDDPDRTMLVLGDAAQSIYARGFSWRQAGLEVTGRSFVLRKNYRNTREVVATARNLIQRNTHLKRADELTAIDQIERTGPKPIVEVRNNPNDELAFVVDQVLSYREQNLLRLRDIAILAPDAPTAQRYYDALFVKGLPVHLWDKDDGSIEVFADTVKVMPIHLAKGLEFPVVFLVGLSTISPLQAGHGDEDEDTQIAVERDRMLVYVGITRCAEILFVVTNDQDPAPFVDELMHVNIHRGATGTQR